MAEKDEIKTGEKEAVRKEGGHLKWWQWILMYPALAIAILGSVPTWGEIIKSIQLGVPFGQSSHADEQNRLWQENFECTRIKNPTTIMTEHKVEIGSLVCESGDVLLSGKRPEWDYPQKRWIAFDTVAPPNYIKKAGNTLLNLFSKAYATETDSILSAQAQPASVICQRWIGNGQLLQRIRTNTGCFDQVINTYTGWVTSYTPAPSCSPDC